ncbi:MAG TPA: hypothetical protein DCL61_23700 [Cyanobacteria bacterium UBA12227]|nr:hypothetical protein [Cyanobacteria bacterium UBA12227]HAX86717.1 hypothetical protein [Cyanobacteria bacterium UBA11370]
MPFNPSLIVLIKKRSAIAIDVFPCEDGHAQERSLLNNVLATKETRTRLKRHRPAKRPHISTAKILSQAQTKKQIP